MKVWALLLLLAGCGDTGQNRITLALTVSGENVRSTNESGWDVTISEAKLRMGPIRFYEGEPLFSWRSLRQWVVADAYAHPGHYVEGEALAEMLEVQSFDLLGAPVLLSAQGVTGSYRSAEVDVPTDALIVAGTATKNGVSKNFSATLTEGFSVKGISFGAEVTGTQGAVELRVDLARWVERIHFDGLDEGPLMPGSQAHNALIRGANNTSAFQFEWTPEF